MRRPLVAAVPLALAAALAMAACGGASDPPASTSAPASSASGASGAPGVASTAGSAASAPASPACAAGAKAPPTAVPGAPLDTILRVPARARGHRAPLILALHFASGTGAQMEQATRYTPQAARSGFAVAYPTASANRFWSIDADLDKLERTLDAVERVLCIDPARVYVSGISNGGFMATVLACRMAGRVAAAALFAPGVNGIGDCAPSRPVSVLEVHGTSDSIVPYRDIPSFVAGWADRDGCASRSTSRRRSPAVTVFRWPGCDGGAQVEHLRLTRGSTSNCCRSCAPRAWTRPPRRGGSCAPTASPRRSAQVGAAGAERRAPASTRPRAARTRPARRRPPRRRRPCSTPPRTARRRHCGC